VSEEKAFAGQVTYLPSNSRKVARAWSSEFAWAAGATNNAETTATMNAKKMRRIGLVPPEIA
jgi:hypothetical protein